MKPKEEHLRKLAAYFLKHVAWEDESYIGLDGKRPFGFSGGYEYNALDIAGVKRTKTSWGIVKYTDKQLAYGEELLEGLVPYLHKLGKELEKQARKENT